MTALTIANAAADLRHLVDGIPGQLLLKDRLYAAADRLEAAALEPAATGECPACIASHDGAVAALRTTILAEMVRSTGHSSHELATNVAESILAAGLAKDGAR